MKEFLDLYPNTGPDAGTGPRSRSRCECGHPLWAHHQLGACTALRTQYITGHSPEIKVLKTGPGYCLCLDYKEEQQP